MKPEARRDCPPDEKIASFVDPASGGVPWAEEERIRRHLRQCPPCCQLVIRLRIQLGLPPLDDGQ
jgi:hypothetical protein